MEQDSSTFVSEGKSRILEIFSRDDKDDFLSCLQSSSLITSQDSATKLKFGQCELCLHKLLSWICSHKAVECATTLLKWSKKKGLRVKLNVSDDKGVYLLHEAANSLSSELANLFLRHGARSNVKCKSTDSKENGLLPLQFALRRACSNEHLKRWTPKQSLFNLVIILCLPEMRGVLETIKVLAWRTKDVNLVFYLCAREGKLIQLAMLLMVAREKVVENISESDPDFDVSGFFTFRQSLCFELSKLIDEEFSSMHNNENKELTQALKERKDAIINAVRLLDFFEIAGDALEAYRRLDRPTALQQQVTEEISRLLWEFGIVLKMEDADSSDAVHCGSSQMEPVLEQSGGLEVESDDYEEEPLRIQHGLLPHYEKQVNLFHTFHTTSSSQMEPVLEQSEVESDDDEEDLFRIQQHAFLTHCEKQQPMQATSMDYGGLMGCRLLPFRSMSSSTVRPLRSFRIPKCRFHAWVPRTLESRVQESTGGIDHYSFRNFLSSKRMASFVLAIKRGVRCA